MQQTCFSPFIAFDFTARKMYNSTNCDKIFVEAYILTGLERLNMGKTYTAPLPADAWCKPTIQTKARWYKLVSAYIRSHCLETRFLLKKGYEDMAVMNISLAEECLIADNAVLMQYEENISEREK